MAEQQFTPKTPPSSSSMSNQAEQNFCNMEYLSTDSSAEKATKLVYDTEKEHNDVLQITMETPSSCGVGSALWATDTLGPRPNFEAMSTKILSYKRSVSPLIMVPYRVLVLLRLAALGVYIAWRLMHPNRDAMWLWGISVACEFLFALSWLLDRLPKLFPVKRFTNLHALKEAFESESQEGRSLLPAVDIFVTTANPIIEPSLVTANTILSILAVDYPVEKLACYLSDDAASLLTFKSLSATLTFAKVWIPFCRKHLVDIRNPEAYFERRVKLNRNNADFVKEWHWVELKYHEFKTRIEYLPQYISSENEVLNSERKSNAQFEASTSRVTQPPKDSEVSWLSKDTPWKGVWDDKQEPDHTIGDHQSIFQVLTQPPGAEPVFGSVVEKADFRGVDIRLPMLVYVSREKRPGYHHNKKAGAMNALLRVSAIASNHPFILNLDCDHYIHNSSAIREAMCFMLEKRGGDRVAYVQFPQRFVGVDPRDRYANHNKVFFDADMISFDGLQGPMYVGTGCMFRRTALYGFDPPRATEHVGWLGRIKIKMRPRQYLPKKEDYSARFGVHTALCESIPSAEYTTSSAGVPPIPLNAHRIHSALSVLRSNYEAKPQWGRRVGWIYGSVTEDIVTGYQMHNKGWKSMYSVTDAFRGTAPINLADRLHQVLRWATGSVEIFFSRKNAILATNRMMLFQRIAYVNVAAYPFNSFFLIIYCLLPALSLFSGKLIVQSFDVIMIWLLLAITVTHGLLSLLEVAWSGISLDDLWRNEQFWVIGGTSAYPAAVLKGLLKLFLGVDLPFTLTSKPGSSEDSEEEKFADLYLVKWTCLMITPICIMVVNLIAIVPGVYRTIYSTTHRGQQTSLPHYLLNSLALRSG